MTDSSATAESTPQVPDSTTATEVVSTNGSSKSDDKVKRTAKDYKKLYDYLYKKYTEKNEELNFHTELESKLVDLIKYYEMRNNSIVDLIHFAEEQDARSIGYSMTSELTKRQENARIMKILTAKPELKPLIVPMMKEDPESWNIRPELNQSLFLLENLANTTVYSPAALEALFEDVNRNTGYRHSIVPNTNYIDLDKIEGISKKEYSSKRKGKGLKRKAKSTKKGAAGGSSGITLKLKIEGGGKGSENVDREGKDDYEEEDEDDDEDEEEEEEDEEDEDVEEEEAAGEDTETGIEAPKAKKAKLEPETESEVEPEAGSNENSVVLDDDSEAVPKEEPIHDATQSQIEED